MHLIIIIWVSHCLSLKATHSALNTLQHYLSQTDSLDAEYPQASQNDSLVKAEPRGNNFPIGWEENGL